jgi:hypothetical protein
LGDYATSLEVTRFQRVIDKVDAHANPGKFKLYDGLRRLRALQPPGIA